MDDTPTVPRLLTLDDLSEWTQTPKSTLYALMRRGEGPESIKIGRNLRFRDDKVAAWLDSLSELRSAS